MITLVVVDKLVAFEVNAVVFAIVIGLLSLVLIASQNLSQMKIIWILIARVS